MLSLKTGRNIQATEAQQPAELGPLMEPDPVGFSFSTPGWYFLGGLLIVFLIYFSYLAYKKYKRNAYRRKALSRFTELANTKEQLTETDQLTALMTLLKIVALQRYGREKVAAKSGEDWLSFLDSTGENTPFSSYASVISDAVYKELTPDREAVRSISELTKRWIKTHA